MSEPIGPILEGLGITWEAHDGDLISDVIVIAKVIDHDGNVGLRSRYSTGMSWIERLGMLRAAESAELADLNGT